jgi:hypothetical protein
MNAVRRSLAHVVRERADRSTSVLARHCAGFWWNRERREIECGKREGAKRGDRRGSAESLNERRSVEKRQRGEPGDEDRLAECIAPQREQTERIRIGVAAFAT